MMNEKKGAVMKVEKEKDGIGQQNGVSKTNDHC